MTESDSETGCYFSEYTWSVFWLIKFFWYLSFEGEFIYFYLLFCSVRPTLLELLCLMQLVSTIFFISDNMHCAILTKFFFGDTKVLETADLLGEVTETVDYYVKGSTIAAGNLFGRWICMQS